MVCRCTIYSQIVELVIGQCQINAQQLTFYLQFIYNLTNYLQFAQIGNWTVPVKCTTAEWECIVFASVSGISILKVFSLKSFLGFWRFQAEMILWKHSFGMLSFVIFLGNENTLYCCIYRLERNLYFDDIFAFLKREQGY